MTGNSENNNDNHTINAKSHWPLLILGSIASLTGILVVVGWYLDAPALIRWHPAFPAMAFNAALLLTVSGAGSIASGLRHSRCAMFCGGITLALGLLTLTQHLFGVDLRIDQLFVADRLAERAPHPGRMAFVAAFGFILAGLALLIPGTPAFHGQRYMMVGVSGGALTVLALVSPLAYLMGGQTNAAAWERAVGSAMAPPLSFGLAVLGVGFAVHAWRRDCSVGSATPRWYPVLVGVAALAGVLAGWQALREWEFLNGDNIVRSQATTVAHEIREYLDIHVNGLLRMARRWEARGTMPRVEWEADARLYVQHSPGYRSIQWVDPGFRVRWEIPTAAVETGSPPSEKRRALQAAASRREVLLIHEPGTGDHAESLLVYVPFTGKSGFAGYIRGVLDVRKLFGAILHPGIASGYAVSISAQDREIYRRSDDAETSPATWNREADMEMYTAKLRVRVWPVSERLATLLNSRISEIVLGLGTLLSLMLACLAHFEQKSRLRSRLLHQANLALSSEVARHRQALADLAKSENRYRDLMEHAADGIFIADTSGNLLDVNRNACEMTGYAREELLQFNARNLFPAEDLAARPMRFAEVLAGRTVIIERPLLRKDGTTLPAEINVKLIGDRLEAIIRDIRERREAEAQLRKLSGALEQTADLVVITDAAGVIEYVNPAFEKETGYRLDEVRGKTPQILKSGQHDREFYEQLWNTVLGGRNFHDVFINRRKDGSLYCEEETITPLKNAQGRITHFVATGKNITENRYMQERLLHLTQHDILTQLPNRALFMDHLARAVARAKWSRRLLAVMSLDVDGLGAINNTLGHEIGDRLLQLMAERLSECARDPDTVARLGGDEFAILIEHVGTLNEVSLVLQKIRLALSLPYLVDGQEILLTASIGISLYPEDGDDAPALLRSATQAVSRACEEGGNSYRFYRADLNARMAERNDFEASLRRALEQKEFLLHYQPQLDLKTKRLCGVEALLRWQHPRRGLLAPHDFLPQLEETRLIAPVGAWLLRTVCEQNSAWRATGLPAVPIAVNVSYQQLDGPDYAELAASILKETGLPPEFLQLEVSDRILSREARATQETLRMLNAKGVQIVADDFIVGESSLKYLKRMPVSALKIDASLLLDASDDTEETVMTNAIVTLAHRQQLKVIADGVETESQMRFLQAAGCDVIQGYALSRPMPTMEISRLLQSGKFAKS